jgi:hypothetical protein
MGDLIPVTTGTTPSRAYRVRTALMSVIGALVIVACGDESTDPADMLSVREESAHYVYLHAPGDAVHPVMQEQYHEWVVAQLGVDPEPLEYRKYRDRAHMRAVTGRNTNGFAEPGTIRFHTIWPFDNHESVHSLVTMHLGHPPALFNEGIAVAHQALFIGNEFVLRWNGRHPDEIAAERLRAGQIPALDQVLESPRFFDFDENLMYPLSGSFVRFLITRYGRTPLASYFANSNFNHSATQTRTAFRAAYGISVDDAWAAWRAALAVSGGSAGGQN